LVRSAFNDLNVRGYERDKLPYKKNGNLEPGRGTFATVHAATKGPSATTYALKEIIIDTQPKLDLVKEEIEILRHLRHPNILKLEEACFEEPEPRVVYLVTSPWAPMTLHHFLFEVQRGTTFCTTWYKPDATGTSRLDPWRSVIRQCLNGLTHLHQNKIIHKDLKPNNILLQELTTPSGTSLFPIIADFGISKKDVPGGYTENLGTSEFQAPAQKDGKPANQNSDMWSLGCCFAFIAVLLNCGNEYLQQLWENIFHSKRGKQGFRDDETRQRLDEQLQRHCTADLPAEVLVYHLELAKLVQRMLEKDPGGRPLASEALGEVKELEARVQIMDLSTEAFHIFIQLDEITVIKSILLSDIPPFDEFLRLGAESFGRQANKRNISIGLADLRFKWLSFKLAGPLIVPTEFPTKDINRGLTQDSDPALYSEICLRKKKLTWSSSLIFYSRMMDLAEQNDMLMFKEGGFVPRISTFVPGIEISGKLASLRLGDSEQALQ
jgi:serine/threonine protein kinase